jgi:hypothetical protein
MKSQLKHLTEFSNPAGVHDSSGDAQDAQAESFRFVGGRGGDPCRGGDC